jgi:hypothetical protein
MRFHTRTEGGSNTGHGPGHGRQAPEAGASPGQRRRDVTADVAPLVEATGEVAAG